MPSEGEFNPAADAVLRAQSAASDPGLTQEELAAARQRLDEQLREAGDTTIPPIHTHLYEGPFGPYVVRSMVLQPEDMKRLAAARTPPAGKVIYVRRTREPIELGNDDQWEGIDVDATIAAFDDLVTARIAAHFPDTTVLLDDGPWRCEGFDNRAETIATCRMISDDAFGDQEWVVEQKPSTDEINAPNHALFLALKAAFLDPLTEEELAQARRELAQIPVVQPSGAHVNVQPRIEVDPRVGYMPVHPPDPATTGGDLVERAVARQVPQETPSDEDDDEDCCENCGELGTADGVYCEPCLEELTNEGALECPFCHQSPEDDCAHFVLGQDSSWCWDIVPAAVEALPCLDDDDASPDVWGDSEIEEVFGQLGPLVMAYDTPRSIGDVNDFYERLAALLTASVVVQTGIGVLAFYSEHERDVARAEVETIMGRLAEGFERLATSRGHRHR